jgi:hypothetical protein
LDLHLAQQPDDTAAHALLGTLLLLQKSPAPALPHLRLAAAQLPERADLAYYHGMACLQTGLLEEARSALARCLAHKPMMLEAHSAMASLEQHWMDAECARLEAQSQSALTCHLRPLRADAVQIKPDHSASNQDIAIVLQGPLLHAHDFTVETVRLYRTLFAGAAVVVSTWAGEPEPVLERLRSLGATVLLSTPPTQDGVAMPGVSNINLQVTSAQAGIRWAQAQGYGHVFKTRTDMRVYNPSLFVNARVLLQAFPLAQSGRQAQRLLAFSDVVKYMPYAIPDKNMFGCTADMLDYWSPPLDTRSGPSPSTMMEMARFGVAESYLFTRYLALLGRDIQWTIEDGWDAFCQHFVFMDLASADLYWCKYEKHREYRWRSYLQTTNAQDFGFAEWLRLYTGSYPMPSDARIAEMGLREPIGHLLGPD